MDLKSLSSRRSKPELRQGRAASPCLKVRCVAGTLRLDETDEFLASSAEGDRRQHRA